MRSLVTMFAFGVCLTLAGCSSQEAQPGTGGSGGSGGSGSGGSGSGGSSATGGVTSSGGSSTVVSSTGGKTGTGGQATGGSTQGGAGSGGTSASGGSGGQAGARSGGATGGGASGSGGARTGGATGSGGATGGAAMGGTTGPGGTTAAGGSTGTGGATGSGGGTGAQHWVGTWTASPYVDTNSNNTPPFSLSKAVVRQVAHVSLGGSQIRVQFSNLFGNGSLVITGAHIALCKATPLVDSTIDPATDKALSFSGSAQVTVAQGGEIWSDPIDFAVPNQGNITITTLFGSVPSTLTQHSGSRTNSYFKSGGSATDLSAPNMSSATKKTLWFFIAGIDVMADASASAVVAIGDSITDGRGTTTDGNNRWTDIMAARLQGNTATKNIATMNQGIGATNLVGTSGTAGQARYARDVLGQSGVKYVIVFHGVNDIGGGKDFNAMKPAYDDLIKRAHDKGLKVFGGTILPFGGNNSGSNPYYTPAHESVRQQVNTYIKSGVFDGVIDFDAALTDGGNPPKLKSEYATWAETDGLHPGPAGYQKMGDSVDLALFR
jgi:lysophospholipase L1-like esterase